MTSAILYENTQTGQRTFIHREAVEWYNSGATIWLFKDAEHVCSWEH